MKQCGTDQKEKTLNHRSPEKKGGEGQPGFSSEDDELLRNQVCLSCHSGSREQTQPSATHTPQGTNTVREGRKQREGSCSRKVIYLQICPFTSCAETFGFKELDTRK